jgi:hypothetical protein
MADIVQGTDVTFDYTLVDDEGAPFELASSALTFVARDAEGATVLTHDLALTALGNVASATGMALGAQGSSGGVVVQTLSAATTSGLAAGRYAWTLTLVDSTGKTSVPLRGTWVVISATQVSVQPLSEGPTRAELRRRIAQALGDYRSLEATGSGTTTTFVDSLNISTATEDLAGCQFVVVSGANAGHIARIQATNKATNTLTLTPAAAHAFAVGDRLDVVMRRGRGWEVREYHQAINDAIDDAFPTSMAEMMTAGHVLDAEEGELVVPSEMYEVYAVEWEDKLGVWHPVPKAQRTAGWGWKADATRGVVTVTDMPKFLAEGLPVRIYGYGRHQRLTSDGMRSGVNTEWLCARACYYLVRGGVDRDPSRASLIMLFEREAMTMRPRLRVLRKGATARVRWA